MSRTTPMPSTPPVPPAAPDVLAALGGHRPDEASLARLWPTNARSAVLDQTLARAESAVRTDTRLGRRRRIVLRVAAASVAAVLGLVALVTMAPRGALPTATALDRLAAVAAQGQPVVIGPGTFLHQRREETQTPIAAAASTGFVVPAERRVRDSWIDSAGTVWASETVNGELRVYHFPAPGSSSPLPLSPAGVAALPEDPESLAALLASRVTGSTSTEEAVFTYVGDIANLGYVPGRIRAAAIRVLAGLSHVVVTSTENQTIVTFRDEVARPGVSSSLVFDTASAQLVATSTEAPELTFTSRLSEPDLVSAVPESVLAHAATMPDAGEPWVRPDSPLPAGGPTKK